MAKQTMTRAAPRGGACGWPALLLLVLLVGPAAAQDRATHQAELDAVCEDTRSAKLTGLRTRYVDECVAEGKDPEYCARFYADYGAATGNRGPLFYDLPECEAAFDFRTSQRRR